MSEQPAQSNLAKWFLYAIAAIAFLVGIGGAGLVIYRLEIMLSLLTPEQSFEETRLVAAPDFNQIASWSIHPEGRYPTVMEADDPNLAQQIDVFFIHPTTLLSAEYWNDPLDFEDSATFLETIIEPYLPSVFAPYSKIYAPRYRQATLTAFRVKDDNGVKALNTATADVLTAFDAYMANWNKGKPFILAGHSQGGYHGMKLLLERIEGTPLADQMVNAWLIGWPISTVNDLPYMQTPACQNEGDTGCLITWNAIMQGGDIRGWFDPIQHWRGLNGTGSITEKPLCHNPLSFNRDDEFVPASKHKGSVAMVPAIDIKLIDLGIGAACSESGGLFVNSFEHGAFNSFLLPDKSLHLYDYALFYANMQENAKKRTLAFLAANESAKPWSCHLKILPKG